MRPTALQVTGMETEKNYGAETKEAGAKDFRSRAACGARPGSMEETSTLWTPLQMFTASTKPAGSYEREEVGWAGGKEGGSTEQGVARRTWVLDI